MAVHRGRSLQAALALATGCSDISRCTGTLGMEAEKCSRSTTVRRANDSGIARPRNLSLQELQHPRDEAFGVSHVRAIFFTERFEHHLFFPLYTEGIEDSRADKSRSSCKPIGQQQHLSHAQKK